MLHYLFAFTVFLHGLIHWIGFAKEFQYGNTMQLTKEISKPADLVWLLTAVLFVTAASLFVLKKGNWPVPALIALVLSQMLIIINWQDAKYGTIANVLILLVAVAAWGSMRFEKQFLNDINTHLQHDNNQHDLLTEADLKKLPLPVQAYLRYTGAVNQPKVKNMRLVFEGRMRKKGNNWFRFRSVQYNFFEHPARLFFMKAKMFGITVPGYHRYQNATATMDVRLFGLFSIVKEAGPVMNKTETVTLFNDMCLMAPSTLIDKRIQWTAVDGLTARANFTNGGNTIAATLFFNTKGQLINFVSDDRTAFPEGKQYRFSTPVKDYQPVNGHHIPLYGEAVWHYPDGEFVYGEFNLKEVAYNTGSLQQDKQMHNTNHSPQQNASHRPHRKSVLLLAALIGRILYSDLSNFMV